MNSFSDIVGRKQALAANSDRTTDFVMRKVQPSKAPTAKFVAKASQAEGNESGTTDLLIKGLIDRLPKPDSVWSLDDRAKWLRTADSVFGLVYKADDDECRRISVAFVKQEAANPPMRVKEESRG
jgi:hypothetical protein